MLGKIVSKEEALERVKHGMSLMHGGVAGEGEPVELAEGILQKGVHDLTVIGMDAGRPERGIGRLIAERRVKRILTSRIGSNPEAERQFLAGTLEVILFSQGILAEKVRMGGVGLPGCLVRVEKESAAGDDQQIIEYCGQKFRVETALQADVAIVCAKLADPYGNLVYDKANAHFNPLVAMAAECTIAQVEEIVPPEELDAAWIGTPGIFVTCVVLTGGEPGR